MGGLKSMQGLALFALPLVSLVDCVLWLWLFLVIFYAIINPSWALVNFLVTILTSSNGGSRMISEGARFDQITIFTLRIREDWSEQTV